MCTPAPSSQLGPMVASSDTTQKGPPGRRARWTRSRRRASSDAPRGVHGWNTRWSTGRAEGGERGAPLDPASPTHDLARRRRPPASPTSSRRLVQCPPADRPTHGEIAPAEKRRALRERWITAPEIPSRRFLPRKRSLRHQFPTAPRARPRRLERRGDMPPALDPTQYHPAIDNVSAGALHRKVRSSSSRRSLVVTIVPPSVTRPSRGVRPSLPTSTPRLFRSPNPQFLAGIRRLQAERRLERTRRPLRLRLRRRRRGGTRSGTARSTLACGARIPTGAPTRSPPAPAPPATTPSRSGRRHPSSPSGRSTNAPRSAPPRTLWVTT